MVGRQQFWIDDRCAIAIGSAFPQLSDRCGLSRTRRSGDNDRGRPITRLQAAEKLRSYLSLEDPTMLSAGKSIVVGIGSPARSESCAQIRQTASAGSNRAGYQRTI